MSTKPTVKVRGRKSATEKPREEKAKSSSWLYTVSTNQRYADDDPNLAEDEEVFDEVINDICNNIGKYLIFKVEGDGFTSEKIQHVSCDYVLERGETTKALHAHIHISISHHSKIHLDFKAIKHKVEEELGVGVYQDGKLVKASGDHFLSAYLRKHYAKNADSKGVPQNDRPAYDYLPEQPTAKNA